MSGATRCDGCGRAVAGGTAGCRAEFDALCALHYSGAVPEALHRLTVDAYSLQHPDAFCATGKSYAAHLGGMLVAREHAGDPAAQQVLRRWLDGPRDIARPEPPASRGELTLADVLTSEPGGALERATADWADGAWRAYAAQHALARAWLAAAFASRARA